MHSRDVIEHRPIHILRVEMKEYSRRPDGEPRWCFGCRERVEFVCVITVPTDPMSYYGPSATIECARGGHADGDCFPGRIREWSDA